MRNNALNAGTALGFYLVTYVVSIENLRHQTNVTDASRYFDVPVAAFSFARAAARMLAKP
jgi:hypothetical protein